MIKCFHSFQGYEPMVLSLQCKWICFFSLVFPPPSTGMGAVITLKRVPIQFLMVNEPAGKYILEWKSICQTQLISFFSFFSYWPVHMFALLSSPYCVWWSFYGVVSLMDNLRSLSYFTLSAQDLSTCPWCTPGTGWVWCIKQWPMTDSIPVSHPCGGSVLRNPLPPLYTLVYKVYLSFFCKFTGQATRAVEQPSLNFLRSKGDQRPNMKYIQPFKIL